jgi:hypothetical protein
MGAAPVATPRDVRPPNNTSPPGIAVRRTASLRSPTPVVHADSPNVSRRRMDCRVKPGNDEIESSPHWRESDETPHANPLAPTFSPGSGEKENLRASAAIPFHLSPMGRGRERSERVRVIGVRNFNFRTPSPQPSPPRGEGEIRCHPANSARVCAAASACVRGGAGSCNTVAVWPSSRCVRRICWPSGISSAS